LMSQLEFTTFQRAPSRALPTNPIEESGNITLTLRSVAA
jgi:hypothetical protein